MNVKENNGIRTVTRKVSHDAPCQGGCPAGVNIPRYIRYISKGLFEEALAVNRERIPLPSACSYACFNPCESACGMNQFGDPIAIRALRRRAVEKGGTLWKKRKETRAATGKCAVIVGAGPCGLTAAYYLATLGHKVTLYDSNPEAGGTLRYGIPRYRLPEDALKRDIEEILDLGVTFKPNTMLGKDITLSTLRQDADAVLIATGASLSLKIELGGVSIPGVMWGLEFLQDVAYGKKTKVMPKVLVIGGGNVAIDAALTAKRLGAQDVDLICLETRDEMPAHAWEIACAQEEGVTIHNSWGPVRIVGNEKIESVEFKKCLKVFDKKGKFSPTFDEETRIMMNTDQVIIAIGQAPDKNVLPCTITPDENLMIDKNGIFTAGDFVNGPTSIIQAIAQGRKAASAIDRFLGGNGDISEVLATTEKEIEIQETRNIDICRQPVPLLPIKERISSFTPIESGYTTRMAKIEAKRCLNCDARVFEVSVHSDNCKACGYCQEVCKMHVFAPAKVFNKRGVAPVEVQQPDRCVGCLNCFFVCPDFAIEVQEAGLAVVGGV